MSTNHSSKFSSISILLSIVYKLYDWSWFVLETPLLLIYIKKSLNFNINYYFFFFSFLLAYINSTREFHCNNSIDVYNVLLINSPLYCIHLTPTPLSCFFKLFLYLPHLWSRSKSFLFSPWSFNFSFFIHSISMKKCKSKWQGFF
jgi:hypothetical protein